MAGFYISLSLSLSLSLSIYISIYLLIQDEMKRRQHEAEQSFLHLEELGVIPRHSTKRPIRKTFQKYKEKKGSPIKYNPDSDIQKKFDLEVMAFLVNSNLHYSFVETKGFRHFVAVTNPQYNIRSNRSMSKRMTGLLFKNLEKAMQFVLEAELPDCHNVAFTYSEWTPNNIQNFVAPVSYTHLTLPTILRV